MPVQHIVVGLALGRWQTNCYVIGDRAAGTCVVVDPGEGGERGVPSLLDDLELRCEAILLTHGHLDHLWSAPALAADLDVPVLLHPDDRWLWDDPLLGFGQMPDGALEGLFGLHWDPDADVLEDLADGQVVDRAGIALTVHHTPGHTPGHVTFVADGLGDAEIDFVLSGHDTPPGDRVLVAGDLLFRGSVGRTDCPRGSKPDLFASIVRSVLPLDDDTLVLAGHGRDTTVGHERSGNPYIAQALRQAG